MANIFDTLLKSKRPQALETISNAEKERAELVKKLQDTLSNSLTELIDSIYSNLPANTKTVKICIDKWGADSAVTNNTADANNIGFGIYYSVSVSSLIDYAVNHQYKCLIPFSLFDSEYISFGKACEYIHAVDLYKESKANDYWYSCEASARPLYFYLFDHKEFQFISLEEIFGGEIMTEFVVDLTKDDNEERHSRKSEDEDEDDNDEDDEER